MAVIVVLGIGFLSQTGHFSARGEQIQQETGNYWTRATEWVKTNIYPRVSSEAEKRVGELAKEADTAKNNLAQSAWEGIKNYLTQKFNSIFKTQVK